MNRPTLPKEVAEAIETLREEGYTEYGIICGIDEFNPRFRADEAKRHFHTLKKRKDEGSHEDLHNLLSALVNGYEIEQTPEEKVREYYADLRQSSEGSVFSWKADAVVHTLDLLGIKIEGVNAESKEANA